MSDYTTNDGVEVSSGVFTLITSWGGGTSNSYISLTLANSFLSVSAVDNASWTEATSAEKLAALLEATRDIDCRNYVGNRKYSDQLLEFPRSLQGSYPWDRATNVSSLYSSSELRMLKDVEQATCFQALFLLQNSGSNQHTELAASGVKSARKKVGPIEEEFQYETGMAVSQRSLCPKSLTLLADWMTSRKILRG